MTYYAAREAEFAALVAARPGTIEVDGESFNCIGSGVRSEKGMAAAAWQPDSDSTFTMLRTDFTSTALSHRDEFDYLGDTFQIVSITNDEKEPTIRFTAKLKK